jgi:hypothetical protein
MSDVEMFTRATERSIDALRNLAKRLLASGKITQAQADAVTGEAAKVRNAAYQLGCADTYARMTEATR